jgi:hypothetical protein
MAKELPSVSEVLSLISYNPETGDFYRNKNGALADTKMTIGYRRVRITINKVRFEFLAHRLAWFIQFGVWPSGEIDHINGNRSDNSIKNLRHVDSEGNSKNCKRRIDNRSGVSGINHHQRGWKIRVGKRYIGYSPCFAEALSMRKSAEKKYGYHENHGRWA